MADPTFPRKIKVFELKHISYPEIAHNTLLSLAEKHLDKSWDHSEKTSPLSGAEKVLVGDFKSRLKKYLYKSAQGRYCCFCGIELQSHDGTKDLEHLIAKDGKKNVVFDLANLALACKDCNTSKGKKKVTIYAIDEDADVVFPQSSAYLIVHPHLDEWQKHFFLDKFRRVVAKESSHDSKGSNTLRICAILKKNAMRLADHFVWLTNDDETFDHWVEFYSLVNSKEKDEKRLKELTEFAHGLADALRAPEEPDDDAIEFALSDILERAELRAP